MAKTPNETGGRGRWFEGLLVAGRTFAIILGTGGIGLLGGFCYGAWAASDAKAGDEVFTLLAIVACLVIYGAIGFVAGMAVGILGLVVVGIVQLARQASGRRTGPPEGDLRPEDPLAGVVDVREPGTGGEGRREG